MKNRYNWTQVAQLYCQELGIDYPRMEEYLRNIYSDLPVDEYENDIRRLLNGNKSEYFPDLYVESSMLRGTERGSKKSKKITTYKGTKNN